MPSTTPPTPERRRAAALAGHTGDLAGALAAWGDHDPGVRATALGALRRLGSLDDAVLAAAHADPAAAVRVRAAELATDVPALLAALGDPDAAVVQAAAYALGELGDAGAAAARELSAVVTGHADPLSREAAVAALGAIGSPDGLAAILVANGDKPAVRRRAVLALAPFDGPEVERALAAAREDRDWQVRQAAEDLLGPPPT